MFHSKTLKILSHIAKFISDSDQRQKFFFENPVYYVNNIELEAKFY